jgi:hypothetical protein
VQLFSELESMKLPNRFLGGVLFVACICCACSSHKAVPKADSDLAYIFEHANSVSILAYKNRLGERSIMEEEEKTSDPKDTVFRVFGELRVPERDIKEEIILNSVQRDSLFRLLNRNMCDIDGGAICYDPRHAIVFYDSNRRSFSYIEICFDCTNYETSGNFKLDFCYEKSQAIKSLFQSCGVTYFDEGEI